MGSSPLARGTRNPYRRRSAAPGLIPARAGNTRAARVTWRFTRAHPRSRGEHGGVYPRGPLHRAHPRSRGEHPVRRDMLGVPSGSSPLARGTRFGCDAGHAAAGLIPARAGNTAITTAAGPGTGAHPRSRGEHWAPESATVEAPGSSPLARGTRTSTRGCIRRGGLIPARAGNTGPSRARMTRPRAHPRSRGEHNPWTAP